MLVLRKEIISTPGTQFDRDITKVKKLKENYPYLKALVTIPSLLQRNTRKEWQSPFPLILGETIAIGFSGQIVELQWQAM